MLEKLQKQETYRPLCLRLYGQLLKDRLANEIEKNRAVAANQFDFIKGLSTVLSLVLFKK